jgi:hypothetical protein
MPRYNSIQEVSRHHSVRFHADALAQNNGIWDGHYIGTTVGSICSIDEEEELVEVQWDIENPDYDEDDPDNEEELYLEVYLFVPCTDLEWIPPGRRGKLETKEWPPRNGKHRYTKLKTEVINK